MKRYAWVYCLTMLSGLLLALSGMALAQNRVEPPLTPVDEAILTVDYQAPLVLFQVTNPRAASLQLAVR